MLKRIMVALAGLFLMLGLAAAPASGAQTTLDMFPELGGEGEPVRVSSVPTGCTATPLSEVLSGVNNTSTAAEFYQNSDCDGIPLETVPNNGELVNIEDAQGNGATHFKAPE